MRMDHRVRRPLIPFHSVRGRFWHVLIVSPLWYIMPRRLRAWCFLNLE